MYISDTNRIISAKTVRAVYTFMVKVDDVEVDIEMIVVSSGENETKKNNHLIN